MDASITYFYMSDFLPKYLAAVRYFCIKFCMLVTCRTNVSLFLKRNMHNLFMWLHGGMSLFRK
jgi:hypothetical protein